MNELIRKIFRKTDWSNATNEVKLFSFEDTKKKAKVVSVYDGDTIKIVFPVNGKLQKWNCRLSGIDTPEVRTKNVLEKELGLKVRYILREKLLHKMVVVKCGKFDKYGRLLVEVFEEGVRTSVNDWLIENRYAFVYDGGTKQDWGIFLKTTMV